MYGVRPDVGPCSCICPPSVTLQVESYKDQESRHRRQMIELNDKHRAEMIEAAVGNRSCAVPAAYRTRAHLGLCSQAGIARNTCCSCA